VRRRIEWAQSALADLLSQIEYIASDNPDAAARVAAAIRKTGNELGNFATGHPGRVSGTYEKSVRGLPYVIAYALSDGDTAVSILRVIHTARSWPVEAWPEA
jgi:toxin ParE1/3/4